MKEKKKRRFFLPAAVMAAAALVSYGSTTAYLSSSPGEVLNVITAGSVDVKLEERNWKPEKNRAVHPLEKIEKNPAVKNTGQNNACVFLQVDIPIENIAVVNPETKRKTEKKETELFTFRPDEKSWELVSRERLGENMRYVYGCREILQPGQETQPLFSEMTAVNYVEGELDSEIPYNILVTALAVQENAQGGDMAELYQAFFAQ